MWAVGWWLGWGGEGELGVGWRAGRRSGRVPGSGTTGACTLWGGGTTPRASPPPSPQPPQRVPIQKGPPPHLLVQVRLEQRQHRLGRRLAVGVHHRHAWGRAGAGRQCARGCWSAPCARMQVAGPLAAGSWRTQVQEIARQKKPRQAKYAQTRTCRHHAVPDGRRAVCQAAAEQEVQRSRQLLRRQVGGQGLEGRGAACMGRHRQACSG